MQIIDWMPIHTAMSGAMQNLKITRVKTIFDFWHTNRKTSRLVGLEHTDETICKACREEEETEDHIICCGAWSKTRQEDIRCLAGGLANIKIPMEVQVRIMQGIKYWLKHNTGLCTPMIPSKQNRGRSLLEQAMAEQFKIGWWHLIHGRLSQNWAEAVAADSSKKGGGKTDWTFKAIRLL